MPPQVLYCEHHPHYAQRGRVQRRFKHWITSCLQNLLNGCHLDASILSGRPGDGGSVTPPEDDHLLLVPTAGTYTPGRPRSRPYYDEYERYNS